MEGDPEKKIAVVYVPMGGILSSKPKKQANYAKTENVFIGFCYA